MEAQLVGAGRVVASEEAVIAPSATQRLIAEFARRAVSAEVEGWASYRAKLHPRDRVQALVAEQESGLVTPGS